MFITLYRGGSDYSLSCWNSGILECRGLFGLGQEQNQKIIEQLTLNQRATGSTPVRPTQLNQALRFFSHVPSKLGARLVLGQATEKNL